MRLAHESPTALDEDESQDDLVLDRKDVFAIDDVEVGANGGAEGRIGTVGYEDLFWFIFEDQLDEGFRYADM